ncbi:MAG: SGNH/GDSL hydrolase family protein [Methylobacterium sp.]|nr:SGNH/GDSL hydrolase family protein [Methylobacterium sp.]
MQGKPAVTAHANRELGKVRKTGMATLAGLGLTLVLSASALAGEPRCNKARHVAGTEKPLPNLESRLEAGEPIRIVALGSSSTEGTPNLSKKDIYPAVLERVLAREVLNPVEILNRGKGGETIALMLARLDRDVIAEKPDLVIWQLGVNDVLSMDGVESAIADMRVALQRLRDRRIPVVLMDLQVAPMVDRDKDTPVMQAAIAEAARAEGVLHFHRYEIMKNLVSTQAAGMDDLVMSDGLHMTAFGHLCTGTLLAQQIAKSSLMRLAASRPRE